jgi:hypothetical protein
MRTFQEREQEGKILIDQADRLIGLFAIDVSDVPPYDPAQKPWNASPLFPGQHMHMTSLRLLKRRRIE